METLKFLLPGVTKKVGHKLSPGTYEARLLKSRFNKAGNLELTLTDIKSVK